jgi:hypothetical protein
MGSCVGDDGDPKEGMATILTVVKKDSAESKPKGKIQEGRVEEKDKR